MSDQATGAMQQYQVPTPSGADPTAGLVLLYASGSQQPRSYYAFKGNRLVAGRGDNCDIILEVSAVSRRHAEFKYTAGHWLLQDLESTNGTYIDGLRIREARLENGAEIRIGDALFKFVDENFSIYQNFIDHQKSSSSLSTTLPLDEIIVGGALIQNLLLTVDHIASSNLCVMIQGETGTGKELFAQRLHRVSKRKGKLCAINCAAIPENLLESELFGSKKGAFSGADRDRPGLIRSAHGGTLFLDEIGDMPAGAQVKLLRVLQNRELLPLGATEAEPIDLRVVCATHRDLELLQESGAFRPDLFARLNEFRLSIPPLRERKEDLLRLIESFLTRHGRPDLRPDFHFMLGAIQYDWPFNVRELEASIKRASVLQSGQLIEASNLPQSAQDALEEFGKSIISTENADGSCPSEAQLRELLILHQGNIAAVGRDLNKARMQVHRWLKKYQIDLAEFRSED